MRKGVKSGVRRKGNLIETRSRSYGADSEKKLEKERDRQTDRDRETETDRQTES